METKPFRTHEEYEAALHRVEELWDAAEGNPESDELDVLVSLIEAYERQNYPIDSPSPAEATKVRLHREN